LNQLAHEVIVGLTGGWKTDFDLLETHLHKDVKHTPLAFDVHRVDERLVAITQVYRAPQRRLLEAAVRPGAVVQHNWDPRLVLLKWHLLRCNGCARHTTSPLAQQYISYCVDLALGNVPKVGLTTSKKPHTNSVKNRQGIRAGGPRVACAYRVRPPLRSP